MKKLFISTIILCLFVVGRAFSQSVILTPDKMDQRGGSNDNIYLRNAATGAPNITTVKHGGTFTAPTATLNGNQILGIFGQGYGTALTGARVGITFGASENWTATANGSRMTFSTTQNGTIVYTERMRINDAGKIGIGTTAPTGRLHIEHDGNDSDPHLRLHTTGLQARIAWSTNTNSNVWTAQSSLESATAASNYWRLEYNSSPKFTLTGDGNFGVGTSVPQKRLHIYNGSAGVTPNASAVAIFEDNTNNYLQLASPEANENGILFGKPSSSASGGIVYTSTNAMNLRTGGNATRITIASDGKVGIGTTAPTAKLDVEGDIVVKKTTITTAGTYNALNRSSGSSLYINAVGTVTVNGIDAGVDGMILYLICGSGTTLVLANENASAATSDRIATHTGANVTISGRGGATLIYEGSGGRWRIVGVAQ